MKLKKLKRMIQLAKQLGKYDPKELHLVIHSFPLPDGTPNVLIPNRGPHVKKETLEIIDMLRKLNPETIVEDLYKANAQAGIKLFSIFGDQRVPNLRAIFFHTPVGSIVVEAYVDKVEKIDNVKVEIDEPDADVDISSEYQLL